LKYFDDILRAIENEKDPAAICTVVSTTGSTPRKAGAKMIVTRCGKIYGTIGGGLLEKEVIDEALAVLKSGKAGIFRHELLRQHNMCCGGTVDVFIEKIEKRMKLYIFGAGHTGQALARFAAELDFDVTLIDDRSDYIDKFEAGEVKKINCSFSDALKKLKFDERTCSVIVTYKHDIDRSVLAYCINKPHAYLGMIGSRRKILVTKKRFKDEGIATITQLNAVDMPIGLDIGADDPKEIAISILAKLIAVRSKAKA
jgi:xanthine dehydrogenase accessory factor